MKSLFTIVFFLISASAFATHQFEIKRVEGVHSVFALGLGIQSISIQEVAPTAQELYGFDASENKLLPLVESISWDQIILVGEKIIEILKKGAPVVNIKRDAVSALPLGLTDWQQLAGWNAPVTKVYQVQMKNYFGMTMVDIRLKVSSMFGGSYLDKGKYLSNVIVVPTMVNAKWGVTLDIWTENRDPVNVGTRENPEAGLGFDLRYRVKTWSTEVNGSQDYFVTGSGDIRQL